MVMILQLPSNMNSAAFHPECLNRHSYCGVPIKQHLLMSYGMKCNKDNWNLFHQTVITSLMEAFYSKGFHDRGVKALISCAIRMSAMFPGNMGGQPLFLMVMRVDHPPKTYLMFEGQVEEQARQST